MSDPTSSPVGILTRASLDGEIARLTPDTPSGRRSETLLKTPTLRVVLVTMRGGTELHEHTAPGVITIQALQGRFAVTVEGEEREMATGAFIALDADVRHAVRAIEDGAFLLTIAWTADPGELAAAER